MMVTAESDRKDYLTQLSNGSTTIYSDTTPDKGGGGDCFRPHDLLCAGFASCLNITIRMVLDRMNLQYEKVITKVDLNRDVPENTTFLYDIEIIGDIDDATKREVISKALNCPVRKTLSRQIGFQQS